MDYTHPKDGKCPSSKGDGLCHHTPKMATKCFHLMLDCFGVDKEKIDSKPYVRKVLGGLVEKIGMRLLGKPMVKKAFEGESPGVTALFMISESHMSFHGFTDEDKFWFDVASCKKYDIDFVKEFIKEKFVVQKMKNNFHMR